jgi:tetratricopeptide (TPR) repeat protein
MFWLRGLAHFQNNNFYRAILDFRQAIHYRPFDVRVRMAIGTACCAVDRYDEAIECYHKAIEKLPNSTIAYNNRGNVYAILYFLQDHPWYCLSCFMDYCLAIAYHPDFYLPYYNRGIVHLKSRRPEHSISNFTLVITAINRKMKIQKKYSYIDIFLLGKAHNNRGVALIKSANRKPILFYWNFPLWNYFSAFLDFITSIALIPDSHLAYNNLANLCFEFREFKWAVENYNRAIKHNTDLSELNRLYFNRGTTYSTWSENIGEGWLNLVSRLLLQANAYVDFHKAIELKPNFTEAFCNRGSLNIELKQFTNAIQDFSRAIEIDPTDCMYYCGRGNAFVRVIEVKLMWFGLDRLMDFVLAFKDYGQAIYLKPECASAYYNRGELFAKLEDYKHAIDDYSCAIEININCRLYYSRRGLAYLKSGNIFEACADMLMASGVGYQ